jgi:hypothetical protein
VKAATPTIPTAEVQITIAATPISTRERNIAFGVIVVIAVLDAIVAPFAHVQLARVDAFIPAVQSVMCVIDLLTAVLLLVNSVEFHACTQSNLD